MSNDSVSLNVSTRRKWIRCIVFWSNKLRMTVSLEIIIRLLEMMKLCYIGSIVSQSGNDRVLEMIPNSESFRRQKLFGIQ